MGSGVRFNCGWQRTIPLIAILKAHFEWHISANSFMAGKKNYHSVAQWPQGIKKERKEWKRTKLFYSTKVHFY